ncbi:unnamed protein product [Pneumocystis jirovecii]|uniref:Uncharacterized protein n=1 Tax=Pneumocystis jirovecii TaxID=42068 RepID=L0PF61_PNEJI|nr:unnamed protein product [Pneumocystis jirovecii]
MGIGCAWQDTMCIGYALYSMRCTLCTLYILAYTVNAAAHDACNVQYIQCVQCTVRAVWCSMYSLRNL